MTRKDWSASVRVATLFSMLLSSWMISGSVARANEEYLYLNKYFDTDGFFSDASSKDGEFDGAGNAFYAHELKASRVAKVQSTRFGPVRFRIPKLTGTEKNLIACRGQKISVRTTKVFNTLFILGSAHHADPSGWIEFEFADGTTAKSPFGLSDWFDMPTHGEEPAFAFSAKDNKPVTGKSHIWLQHTPIPLAKRVTSITLPNLPLATVFALSLGSRDGVEPIAQPVVAPLPQAKVLVLSDPGFLYSESIAELDPKLMIEGLNKAGIDAAAVSFDQLMQGVNPAKSPVIIHLYGATFPIAAKEAIKKYRDGGGTWVYHGAAYRRRCMKSPYGPWRFYRRWSMDTGWLHEGADPAQAEYLGTAPLVAPPVVNGATSKLAPASLLKQLGFGEVNWRRLIPGYLENGRPVARAFDLSVLPETTKAEALLTFGDDASLPFGAVFRYGENQGMDVVVGNHPLWVGTRKVSSKFALELTLRLTAWVLNEKSLVSEEELKALCSRPVPALVGSAAKPIAYPADVASPFPSGKPVTSEVFILNVGRLSKTERILAVSAQGLLAQSGKRSLVIVVGGSEEKRVSAKVKTFPGVEDVRSVTLDDVLQELGHRNGVVVDAGLHGSLNLATMIAALEGTLIVYPIDVAKHKIEVALDLRGLFQSGSEMLAWSYENLWPRFGKTVLASYAPDPDAWELRDYLIANRVFTFWFPSPADRPAGLIEVARQSDQITKLLLESPVGIPVIGSFGNSRTYGIGQAAGLRRLSSIGKYFVPTTRGSARPVAASLRNSSFLSSLRAPVPQGEEASVDSEEIAEPGKIYVATMDMRFTNQRLDLGARFDNKRGALPEEVFVSHLLTDGALLDWLGVTTRAVALASQSGEDIGVAGMGRVDQRVFALGFGQRKRRALELYYEQMDALFKRHSVGFHFEGRSGFGRIVDRESLADLLPATPIVSKGDVAPLTDSAFAIGKTRVFHRFYKSAVQRLLVDEGAPTLAKSAPIFLTVQQSVLVSFFKTHPVPDYVKFVSLPELARLHKSWTDKNEIRSKSIVSSGAKWRYDDSGGDPGGNWAKPGFDDSAWKEGEGEFGYGDDREKTTLSFGDDEKKKHAAYFFRKVVDASEISVGDVLQIDYRCDDGCVVYIDGKEAARMRMKAGEAAYTSFASSAASGSTETVWNQAAFVVNSVQDKMVIAVQVHQSSRTSSDLTFDLKLSRTKWVPKK